MSLSILYTLSSHNSASLPDNLFLYLIRSYLSCLGWRLCKVPVELGFTVLLLLLPQPTRLFLRPRNLMSWEERGNVHVAIWWQLISLD